jgi:hypothetical protein
MPDIDAVFFLVFLGACLIRVYVERRRPKPPPESGSGV